MAILLGLALGLLVSTFTYFNDAVIKQTMFVGNFLPISIFGLVIFVLLLVNPLLRALHPAAALRAGQVAIITAVGLAACAWPGSNFFRGFTSITAMPAHLAKNQAAWQSAEAMSYVPGGSARLGLGHVKDWPALVQALTAAADAPEAPLHAMWTRLDAGARQQLKAVAGAESRVPATVQSQLLIAINDVIVRTGPPLLHADMTAAGLDLGPQAEPLRARQAAWRARADKMAGVAADDAKSARLNELRRSHAQLQVAAVDEVLNRVALVAALPEVLAPMPRGEGLLLNGGRPDRYGLDTLVQGWDVPGTTLGVGELPWGQWWPTIRLYGGMALALGLAALCLTLVVHPQWSRRELLAYPIAKFVDELAEREERSFLPTVARNRLFWYAFGLVVLLHLVNGLNAWFPDVPKINLTLPFGPLQNLFPTAARVNQAYAAWTPIISLTVVAFAFFLATDVSLSVGIALYAWLALGSILLSNGIEFDNEFDGGGKGQMLRLGGYLASAATILYVGRRHYLNVAAATVGLRRHPETPAYSVWGARVLGIMLVAAAVLGVQAGLDPLMSAIFVGLAMLMFLVMSRIVAETGLFFVQTWWMPMGVLTTLFGAEAIGPTTYIVLALGSVMLLGDPRETLMPYLVNGVQMGDRTAGYSPGRLAWPLAAMIVLGFVAALGATFYFSYNRGVNLSDKWATQALPSMPFTQLSTMVSELTATGDIAEATGGDGLAWVGRLSPEAGSLWWLGLGAGLVLATAFARLRLPWWPIHPVLFLVWGTYPNGRFYFSFLLGWLIKLGVVKTMGAKGYHSVKPLMIGIIAGELLSGLAWMAVGAIVYAVTDAAPKSYAIFPG